MANLLPVKKIYCDTTFKRTDSKSNSNFKIIRDLENLQDFGKNELAICPENSAILRNGIEPIHLTKFHIKEGELEIHGHSVMMGYLDDARNDDRFRDGAFYLNLKR